MTDAAVIAQRFGAQRLPAFSTHSRPAWQTRLLAILAARKDPTR